MGRTTIHQQTGRDTKLSAFAAFGNHGLSGDKSSDFIFLNHFLIKERWLLREWEKYTPFLGEVTNEIFGQGGYSDTLRFFSPGRGELFGEI